MLTVAIDATPLLGDRTGVGVFTAGALGALAGRDDVALAGYGLTWAGRGRLGPLLPPGVRPARRPMAAGPLLALWRWFDGPVAEWWTGPVDVVHGTNFVVPPTRRAARVVTVHDLTPVRFPELCAPSSLAYPAAVRRAVAGGAFVHTPTDAIAAEVVALLGAPAERVMSVHHGVDQATWDAARPSEGRGPAGMAASGASPSPGHAPGSPAEEPETPYILALGAVEPRKDFPGLVAAFDRVAAAHRDVLLVIAGPATWGEPALREAIDRAAHPERIRRMGWTAGPARRRLLGGATLLAYPSVYEGFGLPPLEAMAAGVPVVATAVPAVAEVAADAARLVPVGDREALADALAGLLGDEAERRRLVAAGRARAAAFTWERCAAGLAQLYRDAHTARVS